MRNDVTGETVLAELSVPQIHQRRDLSEIWTVQVLTAGRSCCKTTVRKLELRKFCERVPVPLPVPLKGDSAVRFVRWVQSLNSYLYDI